MTHVQRRVWMAVATVLLVGGSAAARQTTTPTDVPRLVEPILFDGRVQADEWDAIPVLPVIQFWPTWGEPVEHPTEIRIAYDQDHLYLSGRFGDDQRPTMTTYRRDAWGDRDDQVTISIDSFNDYETALAFAVYATGARIDAQFFDDARSSSDMSTDWNTFWDALTHVGETGWEVEMRIPFSSLRFEAPDDGPVTMGINVFRYRADGGYLYQYPGTPNEWGYWSFVKPSKGARRSMVDVRPVRPLYIAPYVTAGLGQTYDLTQDESGYARTDDPAYAVGLDVKYSLTSNLTLDLTVNTDFAQVEADNQQVNLTRFSLFFPEKRQFFLERSSSFDFSFGGSDRLFYSRRIGLERGEDVPILGGSRIVGRVGKWDVGFLMLQTGRESVETDEGRDRLDSENFGVLRLKRRLLNENSFLGGITTTRIDEHGGAHAAYGLDGVINVTGDELLRFNWAQTFEDGAGNELTSVENSRLRILWERARSTGLSYELGVNRAGAGYRPRVGFQRREDYTQLTGGVGFGRLTETESNIRNWEIDGGVDAFRENDHGHLGTVTGNVGSEIGLRSGASLRGRIFVEWERLNEGFSLSDDAEIPLDEYTYSYVEVGGTSRPGPPLVVSGEIRLGQFFDGSQRVLVLSPNWSLSERFALSGTYQYNRIRFSDRDQAFDAHVLRSRIDVMLDTRITFSTFLQYNSAADAALVNFRFRYNPRDGTDLFLVFNEGFHTDRHAVDPTLPFTSSRTVIAKYVYTFRR